MASRSEPASSASHSSASDASSSHLRLVVGLGAASGRAPRKGAPARRHSARSSGCERFVAIGSGLGFDQLANAVIGEKVIEDLLPGLALRRSQALQRLVLGAQGDDADAHRDVAEPPARLPDLLEVDAGDAVTHEHELHALQRLVVLALAANLLQGRKERRFDIGPSSSLPAEAVLDRRERLLARRDAAGRFGALREIPVVDDRDHGHRAGTTTRTRPSSIARSATTNRAAGPGGPPWESEPSRR